MMLVRHSTARLSVLRHALPRHFAAFSTGEESKKRKVKVALVTGYTGTGYHGVQIQENRDVPTIEYDVREALFKAGCIAESNYGDMSKIGWSRSSRTDKGVHATSIVLSGKLLVHEEDISAKTGRIAGLAEKVNAYLPETIRIFTATKVHQSFRARQDCVLREYEYFLPLSFVEQVCPDVPLDDAVQTILQTLPRFEGIHDFHNFTKQRRHFYRQQAKRDKKRQLEIQDEDSEDIDEDDEDDESIPIDISIQNGERKLLQRHRRTIYNCRGKVVPDLYGKPYIRIHFTGASFLLNQIRCMVGAAIGVASGALPLELFDAALHTNKAIRVPTAPAEGLVLSNCSFSTKQNLISLIVDHNTPRNYFVPKKNKNEAPHRVLLHGSELDEALKFRDEVIYKEIDHSWNTSENITSWPREFESWKESLSELDTPSILASLKAYQTNEEEKAMASARVVREARQNKDELKLLPRAFSTAVSIHFGITPGIYVLDVISGLKKFILEGIIPEDATTDDLFVFMNKIGLDNLARIGRQRGQHK